MTTSERFFDMAMKFNVTQPFLMSQLAARAMVDTAGSGSIVNISSRSADMVMSSFVAYGAGKAALNQMTRNLAVELAPRVRVNAIGVGGVATQGLEVVLTDDALRAPVRGQHPDGPPRPARGHRLRGALPRLARLVVGHRQAAPGRRRLRAAGDRRTGAAARAARRDRP